MTPAPVIAYQGEEGAHSHIACRARARRMEARAYPTFADVFAAVASGAAARAMIPIENSVAGRVADIHHLLPRTGLFVVGEHFQRVRHQLAAPPGAQLERLEAVQSHEMALAQCRKAIARLKLRTITTADTAGAARACAQQGDVRLAAIASQLAAQIHGLEILLDDIEDTPDNYTRFLILSAAPGDAPEDAEAVITSFLFRVRNLPAALYKALGGFATNGVNMTKLESCQIEGDFAATQFYADIEGHPARRNVRLALEELSFFSTSVRILGAYPASPFRRRMRAREAETAET